MFEHHAYLRLLPEGSGVSADEAARALVLAAGRLPGDPRVVIGRPADAHAAAAWDLALTLVFASEASLAQARDSPEWAALQALIAARSVVAKGWSFRTG